MELEGGTKASFRMFSPATKLLLAVISLDGCVSSLSGIFVNVFLFKLSNQYEEVFLFHLFSFISWLPAFIAAGWISKKSNRKIGLVLGNALLLLFYLQFMLFGERMSAWIPLAGIIYGTGQGFYWLSVNVLSIDLTRAENRDKFNGLSGTLTSISQIIMPFLAGWAIMYFPGNIGYRYVFGLAFLFFVFSIICSLLLPSYVKSSPMHWRKMLEVNKFKKWRKLSVSFTALHFRDDVLPIFIWVTIFASSQNEGVVGNVSLLLTGLSTLSFFWIIRFMKQGQKKWYSILGTIGYSGSLIALLFGVNTSTLLVYAIVGGICNPFFQVPFSTLLIDSIEQLDENGKYRIELVIAREVAIIIGRICAALGLVFLFRFAEMTPLLLSLTLVLLVSVGMIPTVLTRTMFSEKNS